jgi:hypothetical protein
VSICQLGSLRDDTLLGARELLENVESAPRLAAPGLLYRYAGPDKMRSCLLSRGEPVRLTDRLGRTSVIGRLPRWGRFEILALRPGRLRTIAIAGGRYRATVNLNR